MDNEILWNSYSSFGTVKVVLESLYFATPCRHSAYSVTQTNLWRKQSLIVELILNPRHEVIYVLGRRTFYWFLDHRSIRPVVLVFTPSRHDWAWFLCTELCYCTIQHVDLVEEVNSWAHTHKHTLHRRLVRQSECTMSCVLKAELTVNVPLLHLPVRLQHKVHNTVTQMFCCFCFSFAWPNFPSTTI